MTALTPTDSAGRYWAVTSENGEVAITAGRVVAFKHWDSAHTARGFYGVVNGASITEVAIIPAATYTRLLAIEAAASALISGTGGKSRTTEYGECYVPQDADFERLAGVVE